MKVQCERCERFRVVNKKESRPNTYQRRYPLCFACSHVSGKKTMEQRFWEKVKKGEGCWEWIGAKNPAGYGVLGSSKSEGGVFSAHRFSYLLHKGVIPDKLWVLHSCDNPSCVNPYHLRVGDQSDNVMDAVERGRHVDNAGEKHGMSKLTRGDVKMIRGMYSGGGYTQKDIGEKFGVRDSTVCLIVNKKRWKKGNS